MWRPYRLLSAAIVLLTLAISGQRLPAALALGQNSTGSAELIAGSLQPGATATIRFNVTPVADSAAQNDYADGFYAFAPVGWPILAISPAPATTAGAVCGDSTPVGQTFCSAETAAGPWSFAFWGANADQADACAYIAPTGSACGPYLAPVEPGESLAFDVTVAVPADAPTCEDGSAEIPADPQSSYSFFGVLLSDGYAADRLDGTWAAKNFSLAFSHACGPTETGMVSAENLPQRASVTSTFNDGYLADPGPQSAGYRRVSVPRILSATQNSDEFPAYIYYPATAPGPNTPLDPTRGPYPAIVFGHGFRQNVRLYASLGQHLASWGFLVIAPDTANGWFPNQTRFVAELRDALTYLDDAASDPYNFLFGHVDTAHYGASGHSMGGAATLSVTRQDARVKAWAPLAPAAALNAPLDLGAATLILVGSGDTLTPPETTARPIYTNLSAPRQLLVVEGADHCSWQDRVWPFDAAAWCGQADISRDESRAISRRLLTAFFKLYLSGEARPYARVVWGPEKSGDPVYNEVQLDAGSVWSVAAPGQMGGPGSMLTFDATLTNPQGQTETYTLEVSANRWAASVTPASVALAPGQSASVTVTLHTPDGAAAKETRRDVAWLSALAADGLTRGVAILTGELTP